MKNFSVSENTFAQATGKSLNKYKAPPQARQPRGFAVAPNAPRRDVRYLPGSRLDGFAQSLALRTACEFFKSDDLLRHCRHLSKGF